MWRGRERTLIRLHTVSAEIDVGLELMNHEILTWTKVGRSTEWATQAPLQGFIKLQTFISYKQLNVFTLNSQNKISHKKPKLIELVFFIPNPCTNLSTQFSSYISWFALESKIMTLVLFLVLLSFKDQYLNVNQRILFFFL